MGSNTAVVVTGAALVAASLGLGYMTYVNSSSSSSSTSSSERALTTVTEIDEDDDVAAAAATGGDFITEADVCQIFDKLFLELQHAFQQLMTQVQQLQMTGQTIPEAQLQGIVRQEMERALMTKQGAIIEAAGIDADCLETAVWEFLEQKNAKVRVAVERFQKIWQNATGEQVVGWRPGKETVIEETLDPEQTMKAAEVYFSALADCMRTLIGKYRAENKDLKDVAVQRELNLDFAQAATFAGEASLGKLNITQNQFEDSVTAHKNNAAVARALTMLQMRQQQEFSAMQA